MPMSNPNRRWWHIGVAGGIPLLALTLGTGDAGARSIEREIGSGAALKAATQKSATPEKRKGAPVEDRSVGTRNHDPCCADDPPVPRARAGDATTGSRATPATVPPQPSVRSASPAGSPTAPDARPTGTRPVKRASEIKSAPRSKPGEQRRGGVGALIGITFA
jgi:hypothetical protein